MGYFDLPADAAVDPDLTQAIATALLPFEPYSRAVPVSRIRQIVRLSHPTCDMSDRLLNKHIGDEAIRRGFNVHIEAAPSKMPRRYHSCKRNKQDRR